MITYTTSEKVQGACDSKGLHDHTQNENFCTKITALAGPQDLVLITTPSEARIDIPRAEVMDADGLASNLGEYQRLSGDTCRV